MPEFSDYMTRDLPDGLRLIDGGATAAKGFRAGNTSCGIKSEAGSPDLAMLVADAPCLVAATFTTSRTAAHTVQVCKEHLAASGYTAQAVVVNSGNANCSNGEQGIRDARRMAELTAEKLGIADPNLVMVSSTGIIGRPLPMDKVEQGIRQIEVSADGGPDFSRGIMTTDTRPKMVAVEFEVGGATVRLGGSTKGVGMIYPNMATMLCYLTTDAAVDARLSQRVHACRCQRFLQHGLRRRRHVHQRLRLRLRQRRSPATRPSRWARPGPRPSPRRCATSLATWRARWRATAKARPT